MAKVFTLAQAEQAFIELVRAPSVTGRDLCAVEVLEEILDAHGIAHTRIAKAPDRPNLLAVMEAEALPPSSPKLEPMVLISHIDVVAGEQDRWTHPVFGGVVEEGRIHGRGTLDTKQLTGMELYAFLNLLGKPLRRDVYFLATADEEAGSEYGMAFVRQERPELFQHAVVLNEGGGFPLRIHGKDYITLTVGEKGVCRVRLWADGQGGHASSPGQDQAILKLAEGIERIFADEEGFDLGSHATHAAMEGMLGGVTPDNAVAASIYGYAGQCSIDMRNYRMGERSNVLPAHVEAVLSFKVLPGAQPEEVLAFVQSRLAGTSVQYALVDWQPGFESDFEHAPCKDLAQKLQEACRLHGADFEVLPMLALGRTDGRFFGSEGSQVYGCSPVLMEDAFDVTLPKVHGDNESISQDSFRFGCEVVHTLLQGCCVDEGKRQ